MARQKVSFKSPQDLDEPMKLKNHRDYVTRTDFSFADPACEASTSRLLLHCRHCDCCLRVGDILLTPHLCHRFQLSIEIDSLREKRCVKQARSMKIIKFLILLVCHKSWYHRGKIHVSR